MQCMNMTRASLTKLFEMSHTAIIRWAERFRQRHGSARVHEGCTLGAHGRSHEAEPHMPHRRRAVTKMAVFSGFVAPGRSRRPVQSQHPGVRRRFPLSPVKNYMVS